MLQNASPSRMRTRDIARWKDNVQEHFLPLEFSIPHREDFLGAFTVKQLGEASLALVSADAHRVTRSRPLADRSERGYFKVFWQLAGACRVEQGSNSASLAPGQWTFYDTARPYVIDIASNTRFAVLLLPQEACRDWNRLAADRTGQAFASDGASRVALASILAALQDQEGYAESAANAVVEATAALVLSALRGHQDAQPVRAESLLDEVRLLVDQRIGDPELSPITLAEALHISRRTLYAWFEKLGQSPSAFIQQVRLERCRQALIDPTGGWKTITRMAFDHGFSDMAHFSRLFKAAYGASPRSYRDKLSVTTHSH